MNKRAAIYVRISHDKTGAGLGVERQEADCRELCQRQGLHVVTVLSDNDISAYSGKHRPGYAELLTAVQNGEVDVVVAWHADRLLRRPAELEGYITACDPHGVNTFTVRAGHYDLSTPGGRAIARTLAAWASYEVETSTERVKAAKLQAAKAGKWSGGGRAYGYSPDMSEVVESEAVVVRELYDRVIKGETFNRLALDLNARKVLTSKGNYWNALNIRNLLLHKRYAGYRVHHDDSYPATWPALVDLATWEQAQAAIHGRRRARDTPNRKYLLTGYVYCGLCGNRMNTARKGNLSRYCCRKDPVQPNRPACGGIARIVPAVDLLVSECIIYRLSTADFANEVARQHQGGAALAELVQEKQNTRNRLELASDWFAAGTIEPDDYKRLVASSKARLADLEKQISSATPRTALTTLPVGDVARTAWASADLMVRRQIVDLLIKRVVILPSVVVGMKRSEFWNGYKFKPEDVRIEWRL